GVKDGIVSKGIPVFGYLSKYQPGDVLYVRETWMLYNHMGTYNGKSPKEMPSDLSVGYKADGFDKDNLFTWRPSIHMPKWAARTWLEVTKVRVELGDDGIWYFITDYIKLQNKQLGRGHLREKMKNLWDSMYPGSWDRNDWCWVYDFKKIEK
ncbi:hypothetical protein KAR91_04150, partial [Candidatus Pacearchaeota archaeon]|nr:hypothetical protein [Candidatus Pacearchaeota archaeon]